MKNKRVLVFTETALALSETFIANHCRALQDFDYDLVALYRSGDHHPDVPRRLLFEQGRPPQLNRLAFRLGLSRRLDALIKTIRPDIIHAHYLTNGAFLMRYAARHNIPLIVTAHGHDVTRILHPGSVYDQLYRMQRQRLMQQAAMVLPVSNFLRRKLIATGFAPERTRTHYLGVPLTNEPAVDAASNPPRIVFVGRLVAKKGIDTVLEAFAMLQLARPDAELHIVGDGPLRDMVRTKASEMAGLTLHGAQPAERTREIIAGARLLTLPSRQAEDGDVEGFGLVLIEAQALGVPVIASNNSGNIEALIPGKTGLAVDPDNSAQLAQAFRTLLDDPALAREMGAQGQRFVRKHFDIKRQTLFLEELYDEVLQARATGKQRA